MKIINCGRGLHEREVKGISSLAGLPSHWFAFTNLDLANAPGTSREIDVIMVVDDRILVVDLKDWKGPIESREGHWFNHGRDNGPSPVAKIARNARDVYLQLQSHLRRYSKGKRVITPKVQGMVVLTQCRDLSGIAETEVQMVMGIDKFVSSLKSVPKRIETFGKAPPDAPLTSTEWKNQLFMFFNVSKGIFVPGRRSYGGFFATSDAAVFEHPKGIYSEFEVSDERQSPTLGVLRLWDFTKADPRFQTEEGRSEIAGREQEVIAYLRDRCDDCDQVIIGGRTRDPNLSVRYWEVFDRKRRLLRLMDFAGTELSELTRADRVELGKQLLSALDALHLAEAAHLDLGQHSIWVQRPSTVRLSHLMAASYPQVRTLGADRFQFLSSDRLPEDEFGDAGSSKQRDVFLVATAIHRILVGKLPAAPLGFPEWNSNADPSGDFAELHDWFAQALSWDPKARFLNAGEALSAFNAATAIRPNPAEVLEGLERHRGKIRSQIQLVQAFPPSEVLRDDDATTLWKSRRGEDDVLVKVWKRAAWGDQQREGPRILDFLDRATELATVQPDGCAKVLDAMWLGDAIVLVQAWYDLPNLEAFLERSFSDWTEEARVDFIAGLANRVSELHAARLAHGDLKPANILVRADSPSEPIIVDLIDFSSTDDGERLSSRYSPESGGRYERDCFAVTQIADELLANNKSAAAKRVLAAATHIRTDEPANSTLLPLLDAVQAGDPVTDVLPAITIVSPHAQSGPLLPDEGYYYLRRAPWRRALVIRGACEEIEINLDAQLIPKRVERRALDQGKIRSLSRFEFGNISGRIFVEDGPATDLSQLAPILERSDVQEALTPASPKKESEQEQSQEQEQEQETEEAAPTDLLEDDLVEEIAAEPAPSGQIDVARLWNVLVESERELITYGQVSEDSAFDRSITRHKVPFELLSGSFDYNRRDRVLVEREDRHGNWRAVAQLDLQRSRPDTLYLESLRFEHKSGAPLVEQGDELRFRSRFEETSLDRRQAAVKRITGGTSRVRNLINVLDPRTGISPQRLSGAISPADLESRYELNEKQAEALSAVLRTRPLALVQGPPGTGKTYFIAALVHAALTSGLARNVLLASQAHEAVNNAAEAVLKLFQRTGEVPSILRVGNENVVSDPLLPFHVERVEQLQKDRFRAELRERLSVAAHELGISEELGRELTHLELAVRPVAEHLQALTQKEGAEERTFALRETIRQQLLPLTIDQAIAFDAPADDIVSQAVGACLGSVPFGERPSPDRVARFQAVAALARDFVGTVSTQERSLETFLAGTRQIVAGTCVGLGRSALGLTTTPFDLVIVDEAARCTASELAVPIQSGAWIVLIGDQLQLQPQHPESLIEDVSNRLNIGVGEVKRSDFERVFETKYGQEAGHSLNRQYRMLPAIGEIVSKSFYEGKLVHGRKDPIIDVAALPPEISSTVTWIDTSPLGKRAKQSKRDHRKSLTNPIEADCIVALLRRWSESQTFVDWLEQSRAHPHAIGIICAYAAQRDLLRRKLSLAAIHPMLRGSLKIDTIDSYQGKENPIVIVSLVRNNWDGPREDGTETIKPGFLAKPNRINVAMSRAMDRLILVGSRSRWGSAGPMDRIVREFTRLVQDEQARIISASELLEGNVEDEPPESSADGALEMAK
ncbi:AAA domain-containing protein [Sphingomonas agri]|uniref:AAA domain-containing protein n=1 Tax=Sphingomonas agri TaxID=1813878 RepID=UPI0031201524